MTLPSSPELVTAAPAMPGTPTPVGGPVVEARRSARMSFLEARAAWAGARAHNAMRRRGLLIAVSGTTFILTLLALIFVPRQASRIALQAAPRPGEKVDTTLLTLQAANATRALASADSALGLKRALAARAAVAAAAPIRVAAGSLTPAQIARRDSLGASVAAVTRLLTRVQNSPLPSSYRALAEAPELRDEPRVRTLLDSLTDVEREREAFGLVGGVDPIYVALTARATAIGRSIQAIGDRRRGELQQELQGLAGPTAAPAAAAPNAPAVAAQGDSTVAGAGVRRDSGVALAPAAPVAPSVTRVDSTMEIFARTSAQRAVATSAEQLSAARARNLAVDQRVETARKRANVEAPPLAMLMAAVMLSAVFGFGSALAVEVKRPRVADAREAERVARARVLAVVHDELVSPERVRRRADGQTPEHIDTSAESYRMLYLSLSATGSATPFVTVTGDEPAIVATVAANLAAIAANDSRSTLLVDAAMGHASASILFGVGLRAGLGDVARDGLRITETVVPVEVGRDTSVDVVPAGPGAAVALDAHTLDAVRLEIARLSRRYDFTVLTEAVERAERGGQSLLVSPDVIVCARAGHTLLSGVAREIVRLRNAGAIVRGIVVWNADVPTLATLAEQRADSGARSRVATASA